MSSLQVQEIDNSDNTIQRILLLGHFQASHKVKLFYLFGFVDFVFCLATV